MNDIWKYRSPTELYHTTTELYHVGIPGMRWGKRKGSSKVKPSADHKRAQNIRKKKLKELTNKELQEYNNRKNLESGYKRLTPAKIAVGLAAVGGAATLLSNVNRLNNETTTLISNGKKVVSALGNLPIPRR